MLPKLFATFTILLLAQLPFVQRDHQLVLVDKEGHRTPVGSVPASTFAPRVSPDGREVLFDTQDAGTIWIAKLSDFATRRRLSAEGGYRGAMWSGDGKRILYITDYEGAEALFWRLSDGSGSSELLIKTARAAESWSPLEPRISYITLKAPGDYDVWTYSITNRQSTVFASIPNSPQHSSHYSPDGLWIAYVSAETGRLEVYVRRATGDAPAIQITTMGGGHPLWSPDQKELFFDNGGRLFAVAINPESATFKTAEPVALPISGFIQGPLRRQYDLMPDGKSFLMMFPAE
jgi:Tol biopolymer transport system component